MAKGYAKTEVKTQPASVAKFSQPVTNLKYVILEGEGKNALQEEVIKLMDNGYVPIGGVSSYWDKDRYGQTYIMYIQAMVKS